MQEFVIIERLWIVSSQKVDDASLEFEKVSPHYRLYQALWDKTKRIDTLLIDYFGAEDNAYTRQ